MHILLTGATGFIGRHLCRRLLCESVTVRAAVRSEEAAASLPEGIERVVIGDVTAFSNWSKALCDVNVVVHLIARAHVISETDADPLASYRRINVVATKRLLDACHLSAVRRVVFLSSIGVLGRGSNVSYRETDLCCPEDFYGKSKMEAEQLVTQAGKDRDFETVVLRAPLVYGPGVGGNFVRVLKLVQRGVPLPLGLVDNARSMIYVDNLVDAIVQCSIHPQAANETFHVADPIPTATSELIRELAQHFHMRTRLLPVPVSLLRLAGLLTGKSIDVDRLVRSLTVSSDKIRRVLGWRSLVSREEGLYRTVESFLRSQNHTNYRTCAPRKVA